MKQCNACGDRKCKVIRSEYPPLSKKDAGMRYLEKTIPLSLEEMKKECKKYMEPRPWGVTILERMIENQPETAVMLLNRFNLVIYDKKKYPYFYIDRPKPKRRRRRRK